MEVTLAKRTILGCILTLIMMLFITSVEAKIHPDMKNTRKQRLYKTSARPDLEFKAHNIGTMWNVVTNYGSFGDPNFDTTGRPSAEWPPVRPGGSGQPRPSANPAPGR